jgi:solute carrier family 50 protein (sugar transporter)
MISASDIILKYICPGLGAVVANIMFFAPFWDAKLAVKNAQLGDLNPTPWAFMIGNCLGWITYAYITDVRSGRKIETFLCQDAF